MGKRLRNTFAAEDPEQFAIVLEGAEVVSESLSVLEEVPPGLVCDILASLSPEAAERIMGQLPDLTLIKWLEAAPAEAGQRTLSRTSPDRSTRLISGIKDRSKRRDLRHMTSYPPGSVGQLVRLGMISVMRDDTIAEVDTRIRSYKATLDGPIAVLRQSGPVMGVLDPVKVLQKQPAANKAMDCCIPLEPVFADTPVVSLAKPGRWAGLNSLPVVDHEQKLIGFITRSAVENEVNSVKNQNPLANSILALSERYLDVLAQFMTLFFDRGTRR